MKISINFSDKLTMSLSWVLKELRVKVLRHRYKCLLERPVRVLEGKGPHTWPCNNH